MAGAGSAAVRAAALLLAGCDVGPAAGDAPVVRAPVAVGYASLGCYGTCPIYEVTVRSDGTGTFTGRDHVAARGERRFAIPADRFRALVAYIAPLKPERGSIPRSETTSCNAMDGPSDMLTWEGADGARQSLCRGSHDELPDPALAFERMARVPEMLPIGDFIGRRH